MSFLILLNADIKFFERKLTDKIFTTKKVFLITCQVKRINKNELAKTTLYKNVKKFTANIVSLAAKIIVYLPRKTQTSSFLFIKIIILTEYLYFADVFLKN